MMFKKAAVVCGLLFLAGCGGEDNPLAQLADDAMGTITTTRARTPGDLSAPAPSPTPTPTPSPTASATPLPIAAVPDANGFMQLPAIASNFDTAPLLRDTNALSPVDNDVVGAFRFICRPSHNAYDDPIVFPGKKGAAHLHTFFGNTAADANSTYESLRTTGESSCNNKLNRSAYWVPSLLDGLGNVVMPDMVAVYYKRRPNSDPKCREGKGCFGLPRGLRYIFGRTMTGPVAGQDHVKFGCTGQNIGTGPFKTLVEAAATCPSGAQIGAVVEAPECWDGKNLDSADHRSHMSYSTAIGPDGQPSCPSTHPVLIPTFTMGVWYTVDDTIDRSGDMSPSRRTWHFSSDRMAGMTPQTSGMTFHADWFGAWDDNILKTWLDNCIDRKLSCVDGNIGNAKQIAYSDKMAGDYPRRVPVPAKP